MFKLIFSIQEPERYWVFWNIAQQISWKKNFVDNTSAATGNFRKILAHQPVNFRTAAW